jgi:hypothetical protein
MEEIGGDQKKIESEFKIIENNTNENGRITGIFDEQELKLQQKALMYKFIELI